MKILKFLGIHPYPASSLVSKSNFENHIKVSYFFDSLRFTWWMQRVYYGQKVNLTQLFNICSINIWTRHLPMIMEYYFLMNAAISSLISLLFGKIVNAKWLLGMIFIPDSKSTTTGALSDVHSVRNGPSNMKIDKKTLATTNKEITTSI